MSPFTEFILNSIYLLCVAYVALSALEILLSESLPLKIAFLLGAAVGSFIIRHLQVW
ncbi:hypothetical protein P171DRAFT_478283 [Karstenula rhodostoma CBS 690.94]|uniref:Uncharacterized protein n=1 Tax=Karstenula rhodostoma CBS 690.94 TaxID=1392251 RepID=A0A9P4UIJ0_9PLEO|nr:hypothetical protein P171DRAFT_478283 [Karstenula rhodostoma CBS 690.94]